MACLALAWLSSPDSFAQTDPPASSQDQAWAESLRTWQTVLATLDRLQTQQQATLQAIEKARREFESGLAENASRTATQLNLMSQTLDLRREQDLKFIRDAHHLMLTVSSSLAGLVFVGITMLTLLSLRATNGLARLMSAAASARTPPPPARGLAERPPTHSVATPPDAQFQTAIKRLEQRIAELERIASRRPSPEPHPREGEEPPQATDRTEGEKPSPRPTSGPRVALTMGEGEAIGFLPSDMAEPRVQIKPNLFGRLRKLFRPTGAVEKPGELEPKP